MKEQIEKRPLFSVLIPVYNAEKYISYCLRSILEQEVKDIEIVVVDDGSTDRSGEICDEYAASHPESVRIFHKENGGPISARRRALKEARGLYLIFCDGDDYYYPYAFKELDNIITKYWPDLVIFAMDSEVEGEITGGFLNVNPFGESGFIKDRTSIYKASINGSIGSLSMKCMRRECVDIDNDYSEYGRLHFGEDELQSIEIISNAKKIYWLDKALYVYRRNVGVTGTKYTVDTYKSYRELYLAYKKKLPDWNWEGMRGALADNYLTHASWFLDFYDYSDIGELIKGIKLISDDPEFEECYDTAVKTRIIGKYPRNRQILYMLMRKKLFFAIRLYYSLSQKRGR